MVVYHYAKLENWPSIVRGSWQSNNVPGLGAHTRLTWLPLPGSNISCSFALMNPLPKEWINNKHFPCVWDNLYKNIGHLLLCVDINKLTDSVFVADWAHMESLDVKKQNNLPGNYRHASEEQAAQAYLESMVPIGKYQEHGLKHSLPEVIITEDVSLKYLKISNEQPLLDREFLNKDLLYRSDLVRNASKIPELAEWVKTHGERSNVEGYRRTKEC